MPRRPISKAFIGFGLLLNTAIIAKFVRTRRVSYPGVLIMLYGSAIALSGCFSVPPIDPSIPYSTGEASLHSTFAAAAGVVLSVAMLLSVVVTGQPRERLLHGGCFVAVIVLSLLFGLAESGLLQIGKGVIQRVLWIPGLAWLVALEYLGFDGVGQMPFSDHIETSMRP